MYKYLVDASVSKAKEIINRVVPELTIESIKFFRSGNTCFIFLINDCILAKFPTDFIDRLSILNEARALAYLNKIGQIKSVYIPKMSYHSYEYSFAMCSLMKGEILFGDCDYTTVLPLPLVEKLSDDLSSFLLEMHSINISSNNKIFSYFDPLKHLDFIEKDIDRSTSFVEKDILKCFLDLYRKYQHLRYNPGDSNIVFGHFDLVGGNILTSTDDSNNLEVSVIDFGHAGLGDFHRDLSRIGMITPTLLNAVIDKYAIKSGRHVNKELVHYYTFHDYLALYLGCREAEFNARLKRWWSYLKDGISF